jgi:hypothetical protein
MVFLALLCGVLAVFVVIGRRIPPAVKVGPTTPELSITRKGTAVEVRWNPSSPAVKRAVRGSLFTTDDANSAHVNLTAAQVHEGRYEFQQVTGYLFCELTFFQSDNTFVGEIKTMRLNAAAEPTGPAQPEKMTPVPPAAVDARHSFDSALERNDRSHSFQRHSRRKRDKLSDRGHRHHHSGQHGPGS